MKYMQRVMAEHTKWEVRALSLPGVRLIRPNIVTDARGHFVETYQRSKFAAAGTID
jgi:dTDP-4-dehydrorhamnose 3,5-epimerase